MRVLGFRFRGRAIRIMKLRDMDEELLGICSLEIYERTAFLAIEINSFDLHLTARNIGAS